MDHIFSTTGAIRQHHQSVRTSLPSPHHLYHRISPTTNILGTNIPFGKSGHISGYPTSPQTVINPNPDSISNLFRIPAPHPIPQAQTVCHFGNSSVGVVGTPECLYLQGGIHARVGINQLPLRQTSISGNRNPTRTKLAVASSCSLTNTSGVRAGPSSGPCYANPLSEKNYQQDKNCKSHHSVVSFNNQTMNKNRYINPHPQSSAQSTVNGPLMEGGNAAANVKSLIQQISQSQPQSNSSQQQNAVNNTSSSANSSSSSPNTQNQNQSQPQYRIFKRGDSIPGITSPIQISPPITSSNECSNGNAQLPSNNGKGNASKGNSATGGKPKDTNGNGIADQGQQATNNESTSSTDKENSTMASVRDVSSINSGSILSGSNGVRTPLSQIGEIARFHSVAVEYRLVKETGPPHAPTFTVLLRLGNEEFTGEGSSIKKAQHAAAVEALENTPLLKPPPRTKPKKPFTPGGNKRPNWALVQLTGLAQELQLQLQFVQQPVPIVDPFRRVDPPSVVSVHVGDKIFTGEGSNFNAAKNMAVMVALKAMMKVKQEMDLAKLALAGTDEQSLDMENKSPISIVHEMAMKRGLTVVFEIIQETGPPHMKVFTVKCKVGEELETEGQGPTKQAAKKSSSELMIAKLKEIPITLPATSQGVNLKAMQRGLFRQKAAKKKTSTPVVKDLEKQTVSPISRLIQIAHIKKFKEPEFILISTGTESNVENFLKQITERDRRMLRKKKPVFTIEVTAGPHTCRGTGPNKKAAKKAAAEAAIIALGYGPTETTEEGSEELTSPGAVSPSQAAATSSASVKNSQSSVKATPSDGKACGSGNAVKLTGARQIAPGIIVLKSENTASSAGGASVTAMAQEVKKMNTVPISQSTSNREGIEKLAYLSRLLEITVSYSDFPKKNEYLSVVSLTTNPPHVAHGCGTTLDEAQNAAALKILEELSTMGLDSVTAAAEKSSE